MKSLLKIFTLCLLSMTAFAQSVTILPSGITPAMASSIPTLTNEQIEAIQSPGFGSLVNDVTFKCFRFYDGKEWAKLLTNRDSDPLSIKAWTEGNSGIEYGIDMALDANGNIFIAGYYRNSAKIGTKVLLNLGLEDIFLAKYDKNGNFLWVKSAGGSSKDVVEEITVDKNGNVYMSGTFHETAKFGNITLETSGGSDFFIAKYTNNGDLEWAQKGGGNTWDYGGDILTDASGDVYVTGRFNNTASFNAMSVTTAGGEDVFFAKYSSNGTIQWVKRVGGLENDSPAGLAMDANGNLYMIGTFRNDVTFGNTSFTSSGESDIFIAKYSLSESKWLWAKRWGGDEEDKGEDIIVNTDGGIFVAGTFRDMADFATLVTRSKGGSDIILGKLSADGEVEWVKREGGESEEGRIRIGIDEINNLYVCGNFHGSSFTTIGNSTFPSNTLQDVFIAKYNSYGINQWVQRFGGLGTDIVRSIKMGANGNIYLIGMFDLPIQMSNNVFPNVGDYDIFVARIKE